MIIEKVKKLFGCNNSPPPPTGITPGQYLNNQKKCEEEERREGRSNLYYYVNLALDKEWEAVKIYRFYDGIFEDLALKEKRLNENSGDKSNKFKLELRKSSDDRYECCVDIFVIKND